jgi:hypothetical protein
MALIREEVHRMPENKRSDVPVTRSLLTDAAVVATPVAIAAQPLISAWAGQHIGQSGGQADETPPRQEQPQDNS